MKTTRIQMTSHVIDDRLDRLTYIAMNVGFGNVILERIHEDSKKRDCFTDTGVLLIKDAYKEVLITAYIPDIDKETAIYRNCGYTTTPQEIVRLVKKNRKHYINQNNVKY